MRLRWTELGQPRPRRSGFTTFVYDEDDLADPRLNVTAIRGGWPSEIVAACTTREAAEAALRLLSL